MPDAHDPWSALRDARFVLIGAALLVPALFALSCCGGCVMLTANRWQARPVAVTDFEVDLIPETQPIGSPEPLGDDNLEKEVAEALKVVADAETKVRDAGRRGVTPIFDTQTMARGDVGIFNGRILVQQVINQDTGKFLGQVGGVQLLIDLVKAEELVDGRYLSSNGRWFYVLGPTTYENLLGGSRTVMHVMEVSPPSD